MRYTQPQNGPSTLSDLARSLGFTHAWNFGEGSINPANAVTGSQAISLANNASSVVGVGGRAVQFTGTSSDRLEIAGNPFATSTCTYLWVESGIDATSPGQSLTESKYSSTQSGETNSLQIRPTGSNIQIVQAQVAVTLTGTGARDNTGKVNVCALSVSGNNGRHALFTGGNLIASASPASSYTHGISAIGGGSDCPSSTIKTYALFFAPKVIPDAMLQYLTRNFWQLFRSPQRVMLAAAGGTNTPISPGVGALALTGYAPTVTQAANQAVTPGAGSISIAGYAPTIAQPQTVAPGLGSLAIAGYAPTVTQAINQSIVPGSGTLALSGYAPSIAQSANQVAQPAAGSLTLTGYAPFVAQSVNQSIAPSVGSLTITGFAPVITQASASPNLQPGAGMLSIVGYAPTVEQRDPSASVGGGGAGDWRAARDFADRLDKVHAKPTKAAKKLRRKQIEEEVLELLPDEPESRLIAPVIAQAVYRKEAAAVARWAPPQAIQPVIKQNASAVEQAAELEAEALAAQFDASEAIRVMVEKWQKNEAIARELEREAEDESEIEMLLLG